MLELRDYFKAIYEATSKDIYYPSRKNAGIFITKLFIAGGSTVFSLPKGTVKTKSVEKQRKIYNGSAELTPELKASFNPLDREKLCAFYMEAIPDDTSPALMLCFHVPSEGQKNKRLFCMALAVQFDAFLGSSNQSADDIVTLEYQQLQEGKDPVQEQAIEVCHHGDNALPSSNQKRVHEVTAHDKNIQHEWIVQNTGKCEWVGRKLFFENHAEVVPRANSNYVAVPTTRPGEFARMATVIDERRHEGKTVCHWVMIDNQGRDCFPNSRMFDFTLDAKFVYVPKEMEVSL